MPAAVALDVMATYRVAANQRQLAVATLAACESDGIVGKEVALEVVVDFGHRKKK